MQWRGKAISQKAAKRGFVYKMRVFHLQTVPARIFILRQFHLMLMKLRVYSL